MNNNNRVVWVVVIIGILAVPLSCVTSIAMRGCRWAGRAADVVEAELDPAFLLRKYEWFKDTAAQLNKKLADVKIYEGRVASLAEIPRKEMDRQDKEQLAQWQTELTGVLASYNGLAAEYNSQMAKINWRFCNAGQLPKGATETLPREFAPYRTR